MSAFKWLAFTVGIPLIAVLYALMMEFVNPAIQISRDYSTSEYSSTGIDWYANFIDLLPFILLVLLAFMLVVGIIVRRRRTIR